MAHCDNCRTELHRHSFCSDKCRMQYVRKANKSSSAVRNTNASVRITNAIADTARNADKEETPVYQKPNRKGQCVHRRKECSLCGVSR